MNTIFYVHIPKTGGQTLALRLASSFPADKVDILGSDLEFPRDVALFASLVEGKSFIERHCHGALLSAVRDVDVLTTIRDPVSQMASRYLHILREPRHELHRAARSVSMRTFFSKFGDLLSNFQTGVLLTAFYEWKHRCGIDWALPRTWSDKLDDALDRVRWVVPTESIDDFVTLWQLEVRRPVPYSSEVANVAERDSRYGELIDVCREASERYFVDLLLWHVARKRFTDYRERILRTLIPVTGVDDASRSYWNGAAGIWLLKGWHPPTVGEKLGRHWWAGPTLQSEVAFVRSTGDRFLVFSIGVLCGISPGDIWAASCDRKQRLPLAIEPSDGGWRCWIDLSAQALEGHILLCVPRVLAPLIVDPASDDPRRMSFAAHDWGFAENCPANFGVDKISCQSGRTTPDDIPVSTTKGTVAEPATTKFTLENARILLRFTQDIVRSAATEPSLDIVGSQLCTASQFDSPIYRKWCARFQEVPRLHRKQWEYVFVLRALESAGRLSAGRRGLGFGCGHEPLPAVMAALGCHVVATDLDLPTAVSKGWTASRQHAKSPEDLYRPGLCDRELFDRNVRLRAVDMNAIPSDLVGFDFLWSSCALEHLGSIEAGIDFVLNSTTCLQPGGMAVHTTEYNLSSRR